MQILKTRDNLDIAYYVDDFTDPWRKPDTILLIHAAMGSARRWFRWIPALARQYRVVSFDLRGHGNSDIPATDAQFSLDHLVSDAIEILDLLEIDAAHVVGNSAGGYVSQQLALQHPQRVKTLSLYGSTPGLKNSHAPSWLPQIRQSGLKAFLAATIDERFDKNADPDLVRWFIEQAGSNDVEFIGHFISHMCTHYFMDELGRIQAPTLIVAAGDEPIGHGDAYVEMQARIKDAELRLIDTTGHNICDGYADGCVDLLCDFLRRQSSRQDSVHSQGSSQP